MSTVDPEGALALVGDLQKEVGKTLACVRVEFTATGVAVTVGGLANTPFAGLVAGTSSIAEFRALKALQNAPTFSEQRTAAVRKFERRCGAEAPAAFKAAGDAAVLRAAIQALPLEQRTLMALSQSEWSAQRTGPPAPKGQQ